jgi:predicted HicB family RNase H-like nuclease
MSRPDRHKRTATAVRFDPDVHQRLTAAAEERDLSMNWLVNRAVREFLEHLIPDDELMLTRTGEDE